MYEAEEFGVTREVAEKMGVFAEVERMQKLYPEMRRRGIRVLPGGDYGFPYNPNGRNARDLWLFIELFGYTPREVLTAATKFGGELMGLDLGLVKEGFLADLLLVKGNPLEDVRILEDKENLPVIMKDGKFHKLEI
jgi:imidazolonepropionase-like amidohydrolase